MKNGANQSAMRTAAVGALLFSAIAALTLSPLVSVVAAELDRELARELSKDSVNDPVTSAIGSVRTRFLSLGVGKSVVVDLPRDVKDVLVADPKIANAVIRSA
jgi:pilus assembly protein CpaC